MEIVDTMFFNRELSWLRFNTRVLNEARSTKIPLLDRLKFLAIYGTNLDEFYMIRVAGLKKLYASSLPISASISTQKNPKCKSSLVRYKQG